jgi:hypothetical protein
MPKESMTFEVPAGPSAALVAARRIVVERGWTVEAVDGARVVARRGMRASTWPIVIELSFADARSGGSSRAGTRVTANGKIGGYGPIQRRGLRQAMDAFRASLEFDASAEPETG